MSSDLSASYPTGEYLIGNFITDYVNGYTYFDRNVVRKYGDRGLEVDSDTTLDEACLDWLQDVNSIVFSHLNDWAKMYSASLKDYEPLWNVDGTVTTTYGETENTKEFGATQATDQFGNTSETTQYGQKQRTDVLGATQDTDQYGGTSETLGSHTDTTTEHARSYSSGTQVEPKGESTVYGQQVNSSTAHTDTHSSIAHTDTHTDAQCSDTKSATAHTDTHSEIAHTDVDTGAEHVDTERRTGNIGVTKSTELIESEYKLRLTYNFFELIFKYMIKEMGVIYYDWNRCF